MPAADPRLRARTALLLAGGYAALIAVVGFWPERIDVPFETTIEQLLAPLEAGTGLPVMYGYKVVEFAANALLFLPLGLIATLALGARRAWWAVAGGFVLSCLVELGQWLLLPDRTPSARDVLANTCGAAIGALIAVAALARQRRAEARRLTRSSPRPSSPSSG